MIGKTFLHFRDRFEPRFSGGDFGRSDGGQQSASANGVHRAMVEVFLEPEEVHVVGYDERNAECAAEALGFADGAAVAGGEVLHFDVETVGEDLLEL